jgi:stage IV sporulation protein FB
MIVVANRSSLPFRLPRRRLTMALSFRIADVPVRVVPSFFIMALLFGASLNNPVKIALWVTVVFVSVVVHELGHATMGRAFGLQPSVMLHGTGGTTSWTGSRKLSTGQRIAISFAGPGAGFALGAVVFGARWLGLGRGSPDGGGAMQDLGAFVVHDLIVVNFWWGLLNLLPMLPLDGGNILAQALNALTGGRGERPARLISLVLAALGAAYALMTRSLWPALLAASFVASNWQALAALAAAEREGKNASAKGSS